MGINVGIGTFAFSASASATTPAQTSQATGSTFVIVVASDGGTLNAPTDSKSNTYTAINAQFALDWGGAIRLYYCENATGGASHTFSGSYSGTTGMQVYAVEITGGKTSGILDQTTAWISDLASPYTTNTTGTTTQANELALVHESLNSTGTTAVVWGNGYTLVPGTEDTNAAQITGGFGYKILSATGTESGSITSVNSVAGNGIVVTFKELLTGPTINTQPASTQADIGGTASFTIAATSSGGALSYQWKFNGSNVGSNSTTYTRSGIVSTDQNSSITCVVTDSNGSVTSNAAIFTLNTSAVYLWDTSVQSGNDVWLRDPTSTAASGVTGTLTYTNANDTLAAAGTPTLTGSLSKTNNNDTLAAVGTTVIVGTLAKTNNNDTLAASGTTTIPGTLATTNANDTLAASGSVGATVTGTLAYTNNNDTLAGSGTTVIVGALAKTNNNDTLSSSGTTTVTGAVSYTNNNDTLAASGQAGAVTGTVNYTNNNDTLVASGIVTGETTNPHLIWGMAQWNRMIRGKRIPDEVAEIIEEVVANPEPIVLATPKTGPYVAKRTYIQQEASLRQQLKEQNIAWRKIYLEALYELIAQENEDDAIMMLMMEM